MKTYYHFNNFIDGHQSHRHLDRIEISSIDQSVKVSVPDSDKMEIIRARSCLTNYGDGVPSLRTANIKRSLDERIGIVQDLYLEYSSQKADLIDTVHLIHGTSKPYLYFTMDKLSEWVSNLDKFITKVSEFSQAKDGIDFNRREVLTPFFIVTAGNFEVYEPFYIIAQLILSGTHFIVRPSVYDLGTHVLFEIMGKRGYLDFGQKITWNAEKQPDLIKHLIRFSRGVSIFGSDDAIKNMLIDSVKRKKSKTGEIYEYVFEDLSQGRKVLKYGSGNSMIIVLGNPEKAAEEYYSARVLSKGNKCWSPDGAIVLKDLKDAFFNRLVDLDNKNQENWPRYNSGSIEEIITLAKVWGKVAHGHYGMSNNSLGLFIYDGLNSSSPYFEKEVTFPAAGIITVNCYQEAIDCANQIIMRRGASAYLSLGYFGPDEYCQPIMEKIPSEAIHLNSNLTVDLMQPHQGSYVMLDPTIPKKK